MKTRKALAIAFGFVLALGPIAPAIWGSARDQATQLTFTQSVEIPGNVVLQPGTYWFTVADSTTDRNIVRVFDQNWQPITTTMATSTQHNWTSDNTVLMFAVRSADQPNVLLKWYYPGDTMGHEFVYSGAEGRAISEDTTNVVTVNAQPAPAVPAYSGNTGSY
jgi:hypothetical protein